MTTPTPTLQLAQVLSDLHSLRQCDPNAALAREPRDRHARHAPSSSTNNTSEQIPTAAAAAAQKDGEKKSDDTADTNDTDLQRAKDLVQLHYAVKVAHTRGEFGERLEGARRAVRGVVG